MATANPARNQKLVQIAGLSATALIFLLLFGSAYVLLSTQDPPYIAGWIFFISILALIGFAALVMAGLDLVVDRGGAYMAALVWTAIAVNAIAAIITVAAYIAQYIPPPPWNQRLNELAVVIGAISALLVWPMLALICCRSAAADRANTRAYAELRSKLADLNARLRTLAATPGDTFQEMAYQEACDHRDFVAKELGLQSETAQPARGLRWVLATGYIDLWNRMHRAEEALILLEPTERVVGAALYDEFRIKGSTMKGKEEFVPRLQKVRRVLSAFNCFDDPPSAPNRPQDQVVSAIPKDKRAQAEREARQIFLQIRRTLNEFRDESRDGLVVARNRLIRTGTLCGLTAYILLALAIIMSAPVKAIVAASAFFLVGAIINLFNQLRLESQVSKAVDDYGLSTARMVHRPLFSGLAAIGGVVVIALLPNLLNPQAFTPSRSQTPVQASVAPPADQPVLVQLEEVFDLEAYPFGLILAAVFGLTPELLVSRLEQQAERFKANLDTTEAADQEEKT